MTRKPLGSVEGSKVVCNFEEIAETEDAQDAQDARAVAVFSTLFVGRFSFVSGVP